MANISNLLLKRRVTSQSDMLRVSRGADNLPSSSFSGESPNISGSGNVEIASFPKFLCNILIVVTTMLILAVLTLYRVTGGAFDYQLMKYSNGMFSAEKMSNDNLSYDHSLKRLHDYCPLEISTGSEGTFPAQIKSATDGLTLKHLLITIRHGDRSAIHSMPGSSPIGLGPAEHSAEHSDGQYYLDVEALEYRNMMDKFGLDPIHPESKDAAVAILSTGISAIDKNSEKNPEISKKSEKSEKNSDIAKKDTVVKMALDSLNKSTLFRIGDFP